MFAAVVAVLVLTAIAAVLISPAVPSDPTLLPVSTLLLVAMMTIGSLLTSDERHMVGNFGKTQPTVLQLQAGKFSRVLALRC